MPRMKARILVVEDEPQLRGLLRLYLERDGHTVTDAGDGPAALAAYDAQPHDLVILDLMLPGMQGETILEALREAGSSTSRPASKERIGGGASEPEPRERRRMAATRAVSSCGLNGLAR